MPAQVHGSSGIDGSIGAYFATLLAYGSGQVYLQICFLSNPLSSPVYTIQTIYSYLGVGVVFEVRVC
jgi:hypothetical protein